MMDVILNAGPVSILLLLCVLVSTFVFLERMFNLHRAQIAAEDFLKGVFNILSHGNPVEAVAICEEAPGPVARLALAAVLHHDDTLENIDRAIEEAGLEEIPRMEKGLGLLATVARISPLLGLFGTVLGFMKMLLAAKQQAPLVQSASVFDGMWEALFSTAFSLIIAILVYAAYNLLVSRIESILLDMERSASSISNFMRQLHRKRAKESA